MSWDGMLQSHSCKICGKTLNADSGHPAELYAGTYTGLCYDCEKAPRYAIRTYEDGAICYSYAPDCPSWRRDRTENIAYQDCPTCNGDGRLAKYKPNFGGWTYHVFCETCWERFYVYPPRKRQNDIIHGRLKLLYNITDRLYQKAVLQACKTRGIKVSKKNPAPEEIAAPIRAKYYDRYDKARKRWLAIVEKKYPVI